MFGTCKQVGFIVFLLSWRVRLLHATTRGGIVTGCGKAEHGAIGKLNGHLHEAFAETAPPDNGTAVVVLYGTGKDFAGRSRGFIHQHHKGQRLISTAPICAVLLTLRLATLGVNNELVLRQELID